MRVAPGVDAGPQRCVEAGGRCGRRGERLVQSFGAGKHATNEIGVEHGGATRTGVGCRAPRKLRSLGCKYGEPLGLVGQLASLALDLLTLVLVDLQHPDLTFAAEPRPLELGRSGTLVSARRLPARLVFEAPNPGEVGAQFGGALRARFGACPQRRLEPGRNGNGCDQSLVEPIGAGGEPPKHDRIGGADHTQVSDLRVGGLRLLGARGGVAGLPLGQQRLGL